MKSHGITESTGECDFQICAIVPVYRHVAFVGGVVKRLTDQNLNCFLVNDGNSEEDTKTLHKLFENAPNVSVIDQYPNQGKGAAAFTGFKAAAAAGFTHAVQVDADGQHTIEDFPKLRAQSKAHPQHIVTGIPAYDDSVPKVRFYGRYLTHALVWLETLSLEIKDSMCGFRIYPLAATLAQLEKRLAARMDFDTQIIVRMHWAGTGVICVPTKVTYPENGVSNFRLWRDNVRMTRLHIALITGMLLRLPVLLKRRWFK